MTRLPTALFLSFFAIVACQGVIDEPLGEPTDPYIPPEGLPIVPTEPPPSVEPTSCATPSAFFESTVWPLVMEARCIGCHVDGARAADSRLSLVDDPGSEAMALNYQQVERLAREKLPEFDNRSLLELKPTNAIEHGGAAQIVHAGSLHRILLDFISRVDGEPCDTTMMPPLTTPFYEGVTYAEPTTLLRRVTLVLAGRLPTEAERAAVREGGQEALDGVLDALFEEEAFVHRIQEGFGDILNTAGYEGYYGAILNRDNFINTRNWVNDIEPASDRHRTSIDYDSALRREPIELVGYIVENDRSFTEILTADYTMVSPYTARGYGIFESLRDQFTDVDDPFEYIPAQLPALTNLDGDVQRSDDGFFPHAGVITTTQWLRRYQSTESNRNRGRTRVFYEQFLGVDLLALAPAVSDTAAEVARFDNPTMHPESSCYGCHTVMDPVAGLFQNFDGVGGFIVTREEPWYDDMFAPGYQGDEDIPAGSSWRSLQWLGARAAADPRFAAAMAQHAYYILTQRKVATQPLDTEDPLYASRTRAYGAQQDAIRTASEAFTMSGFNLKAAFRSLIHSDFYRVDGTEVPTEDARRRAELEIFGLGAVLTPEQLTRKVRAIFDVELTALAPYRDMPGAPTYQRLDGYMLYGGVNQSTVTERPTVPTGVMGARMRDIANSVACSTVMAEFVGERDGTHALFPHVDIDTDDAGRIRDNLVWLHDLLLGQELDADAADIAESYALFVDVRDHGAAAVASGEERQLLPYRCTAGLEQRPEDPAYRIRAWQAVITYLLRRPEFLLH